MCSFVIPALPAHKVLMLFVKLSILHVSDVTSEESREFFPRRPSAVYDRLMTIRADAYTIVQAISLFRIDCFRVYMMGLGIVFTLFATQVTDVPVSHPNQPRPASQPVSA
jgi:hypothetical protein